MMDVLANLKLFVQYNALPQETYDRYLCTLKLVMAKVNPMAWVIL